MIQPFPAPKTATRENKFSWNRPVWITIRVKLRESERKVSRRKGKNKV